MQLVTIKVTSDKDSRQVGDVVGVYPDTTDLSGKASENFLITEITDEDYEKYKAAMPVIRTAFQAASTEWTVTPPTEKRVWKNADGDWCELKSKPFSSVNYKDGLFTEQVSKIAANATVLVTKDAK